VNAATFDLLAKPFTLACGTEVVELESDIA
jgi:hypothetical protein